MNSSEFYLWLNGYLEALESEGIDVCKIKNIREKMGEIKKNQERVIFGPSVNQPPTKQSSYAPNPNNPIARK